MKILAQSRKDASALRHAVERILGDDSIEVQALGGFRGERLCKAIGESSEPLTLVVLGRDEEDSCNEDEALGNTPFTKIIYSRTRRPRNSTLEMLASLISWGKAWLRLETSWSDTFVLSRGAGVGLNGIPVHPESDSFLLIGRGLDRLLAWSGLPKAGSLGLLFKGAEGRYTLFASREPTLRFILEKREYNFKIISKKFNIINLNLNNFISKNINIIKILEKYSLNKIIESNKSKAIVPLSGGKDSAAALLLAVKALGPENVIAVYVDTGIDFPQNRDYVEYLASHLGVSLNIVRAGVDSRLIEGYPLPDPRNRWCTGLKLEALVRTIKNISNNNYLLILGDRDAESARRGKRPLIKKDPLTGLQSVAPLKYWGGAHVLTYLLANNVKLNPLYQEGFLRLGCYLCFALRRSWEIKILEDLGFYKRIMHERPDLAKIISRFLLSGTPGDESGSGEETPINH